MAFTALDSRFRGNDARRDARRDAENGYIMDTFGTIFTKPVTNVSMPKILIIRIYSERPS